LGREGRTAERERLIRDEIGIIRVGTGKIKDHHNKDSRNKGERELERKKRKRERRKRKGGVETRSNKGTKRAKGTEG